MRLIDADELKEQLEPFRYSICGFEGVLALIDNAPTVDGYTKRPQGEWIVSQTYDCHSDIINIYTCPFCGKKEYAAYPFCHCGAELKGDTE